MATIFKNAIPANQSPIYRMLMEELQRQESVQPQPAFSREEANNRIRTNNETLGLGLLGQLSGDQGIQGVGGQVFKQALQGRQERVTNRGIQDPLTGETQIDPEYAAERNQTRRGQVLQQALSFERDRMAAEERVNRDTQAHQARLEEIRTRNSGRGGGATFGPNGNLPAPAKNHQWNEDGTAQVPIQGTPEWYKARAADAKLREGENKANTAVNKAVSSMENTVRVADTVLPLLDDVLKDDSWTATGIPGAMTRKIPGTPAFNIDRKLDTVRANIGFQELKQMRLDSPTGGALGQVAVKELEFLQAALGNLDLAQSDEQFKAAVASVKQHFQNFRSEALKAKGRLEASQVGGYVDTIPRPGDPPVREAVPVSPAPASPAAAPAAPGRPRVRIGPNGEVIRVTQ